MLQISGVLELWSQQLRHHSLKMINATICGTATTEFWSLMESYFGIDEDAEEGAVEDAQSLTDILAQKRAWVSESVPSITKGPPEEVAETPSTSRQPKVPPTIILDEDDEEGDIASVHSTQSGASSGSLQTLAAKKKANLEKYPSLCSLKEATLFYPTSATSLHMTGVQPEHITDRKRIGAEGSYKGYYSCAFKNCSYIAQTHGVVATHIRKVHLGHALSCRFCPATAWWQARYWSDHMDKCHSDQPKYEPLTLPEGTIKAEEVSTENIPEEDHFVVQQTWSFPQEWPAVPIHHTEPKREAEAEMVEVHQSSKKMKFIESDLEDLFTDSQ